MSLKQALIEAGYEPVYSPVYDLRHVDTRPEDIKEIDEELRNCHEWAQVVEAVNS